MEKYDWIIGICNTDADGVSIYKFYGDVIEMKEKIISLIEEDRNKDKGNWEYGTKNTYDVLPIGMDEYELYGYGCYSDYHIDYTARRLDKIESI